MRKKIINKVLMFLERKSIKYVEITYFIFALTTLISNKMGNKLFYNFFTKTYQNFLDKQNSELITIATVFIGIYFSIYTILMSASEDSAYGKISPYNKVFFIRILNQGFFTSFSYVIFSLISSYLAIFFPLTTNLVMLGLLISFLYTALIFGIDIKFLIKSDIMKNL